MTDYINKLVMRTLGTRPTAQPIIAPFYAPDSTMPDLPTSPNVTMRPGVDDASDMLGAPDFINKEPVQSHHQSVVKRPMARVEPPAPPASLANNANRPDLLVATEQNAPPTRAVSDQTRAEKVETPEQQAIFAQRGPNAAPSIVLIAPVKPQTEQVVVSAWQQREPVGSASRKSDQPLVQAVEPATDKPLLTANQTTRTIVQIDPMAPQIVHPSQSQFATSTAVIEQGRLRNSPAREASTAHEATPVPTIQVTIGRVEVRAVQQAAPAVRAQPKAALPATSLEDYLRGQTGGQR